MAQEYARFADELEAYFSSPEVNPRSMLVEHLEAVRPETQADLIRAVSKFYEDFSPDDASTRVAGGLLAASAMAMSHLNGNLVRGWPSVDALVDGAYWKSVSGASDDEWARMGSEASINARRAVAEAAGTMLLSLDSDVSRLGVSLKKDQFNTLGFTESLALIVKETVEIVPAAYSTFAAWKYAEEKAARAEAGDVVIYVATIDEKTRPNHAALNGFSFRYGSKVSENPNVWAPNGVNCRCSNQIIKGAAAESVVVSGRNPPKGAGADPQFHNHPRNFPKGHQDLSKLPPEIRRQLSLDRGPSRTAELDGRHIDYHRYKAGKITTARFREEFPDWNLYEVSEELRQFNRDSLTKQYGEKVASRVTDEEAAAIQWYSYWYDGVINGSLRAKTSSQPYIGTMTKVMSSGLNKLPPHRGTVYRGAVMPRDFVNSYRPGVTIANLGYISASESEEVADFFIRYSALDNPKATPVKYVINSKTGRSVRSLSFFTAEEEVLFHPNTLFTVTAREEIDDTVIVYLDEK